MRRGLLERAIAAPFEILDTGMTVLMGDTSSAHAPRKRTPRPTCSTCKDTKLVAIPDASGKMVAVTCPYCEGW